LVDVNSTQPDIAKWNIRGNPQTNRSVPTAPTVTTSKIIFCHHASPCAYDVCDVCGVYDVCAVAELQMKKPRKIKQSLKEEIFFSFLKFSINLTFSFYLSC
jgi:hypothetical protein